jgi:acetyl esterase
MIMYFHGGGWLIGPGRLRQPGPIANRTGALVVSVDYRLAPEHVYPAAFDELEQ